MTKALRFSLTVLVTCLSLVGCGDEDNLVLGLEDEAAASACQAITFGTDTKVATADSINALNPNNRIAFRNQPFTVVLDSQIQGEQGFANFVVNSQNREYRIFTKKMVSIDFQDEGIEAIGPKRNAACPDQKLNDYSVILANPADYPVLIVGETRHAWMYIVESTRPVSLGD